MSQAYKCDRCGAYFEQKGGNGGGKFFLRPLGLLDTGGLAYDNEAMVATFDLCYACATRVMRFVRPDAPVFKADGTEYYSVEDETLEDR